MLPFFFERNSLFPYRSEKNKMSLTKNKKCVLHSVNLFPGSYKGLQITQKLSCIKHIGLLLASSVGY